MAPRPRHHVGPGTVARGRPGTRRRVCSGHSRCRATATCVHDPEHCELLDGRWRCSSAPGCGSSSAVVHGTPAGRTKESKKNFCCVTTRRHNLGCLWCLGQRSGTLTARTLGLGVLGFGRSVQTPSGLPLRRLPAPDLPLAFRILAVTLVPTPRLVLPPAAFTQAHPRPRAASTGTTTARWFIVAGAHGSQCLPRDSPGRTCNRSSRALVQLVASRPTSASLPRAERTRQRKKQL
jgi:hypothetical protein